MPVRTMGFLQSWRKERRVKDLISREKARDEILSLMKDMKLIVGDTTVWQDVIISPTEAVHALRWMPSADAVSEPQWIPCSERLPIGQEEVIISCHDDSGDTPYDYTTCGWVTNDGEYWIADNEINSHVVAWMPLPKPYKVESREE